MPITLTLTGIVDGQQADAGDVTVPFLEVQAVLNGSTAMTPDINGGTIDGATIGASTPASGTFTTLAATTGESTFGRKVTVQNQGDTNPGWLVIEGMDTDNFGARFDLQGGASYPDWQLSIYQTNAFFGRDDADAATSLLDIKNAGAGGVVNAYIQGYLELDGALNHDGTTLGVFATAPTTKQTVTGSRGANAALASLLTALAAYGLITDSSS